VQREKERKKCLEGLEWGRLSAPDKIESGEGKRRQLADFKNQSICECIYRRRSEGFFCYLILSYDESALRASSSRILVPPNLTCLLAIFSSARRFKYTRSHPNDGMKKTGMPKRYPEHSERTPTRRATSCQPKTTGTQAMSTCEHGRRRESRREGGTWCPSLLGW
jgi:hypothetical protein